MRSDFFPKFQVIAGVCTGLAPHLLSAATPLGGAGDTCPGATAWQVDSTMTRSRDEKESEQDARALEPLPPPLAPLTHSADAGAGLWA